MNHAYRVEATRRVLIRTEARLRELERKCTARSKAIKGEGQGALRLRIQLANRAEVYRTRRVFLIAVLASAEAILFEVEGVPD